jgi:hypothetical protein
MFGCKYAGTTRADLMRGSSVLAATIGDNSSQGELKASNNHWPPRNRNRFSVRTTKEGI